MAVTQLKILNLTTNEERLLDDSRFADLCDLDDFIELFHEEMPKGEEVKKFVGICDTKDCKADHNIAVIHKGTLFLSASFMESLSLMRLDNLIYTLPPTYR